MIAIQHPTVTVIICVAVMAFAGPSTAAEVYKWYDEKGAPHFTDDPARIPESAAQKIKTLQFKDAEPVQTDEQPASSGYADPAPERGQPGAGETQNASAPVVGLETGNVPPDADFVTLDGRRINVRGKKGSVLFLNFWATWCGPCRKEMPSMQALYEKLRAKRFEMIAVSDEAENILRAFLAPKSYSFPVSTDPQKLGKTRYNVTSIPHTYIIARDGTIAFSATGGVNWDDPQTVRWIESLLVK